MATAELGPNQWYSARTSAVDAAGTPAGAASVTPTEVPKAGMLADLPLSLPETAGGRIAIGGLALVLVAAFLPWSPLLTGLGYFDAWGFSRSSRLVVFAIDLVLLLVALLPIGLSARVRTGWLPLVFGTFVVGVFWERVDSIAVVGIGAWLFALGGLLAAIGGLLNLISRGEPTSAATTGS